MSQVTVTVLPRPDVDVDELRRGRVARLVGQMEEAGVDLLVLTNPVSLRYAADWREYATFQSHIPTYYLAIRPDGRMTMFGAYAEQHATIDEFRTAHHPNVFDGGMATGEVAAGFAADVAELTPAGGRVAVERVAAGCWQAMADLELDVVDGEPLVERARSVKSAEEMVCVRHSIAVAEAAMATMREHVVPGVTENELLAIIHQSNIANDGDWIDGRMLCSGPRTNPWYQEASDRPLADGDLLAFDTDMIGPFGYCADISRTWLVGDGPPTADQRDRYRRAHAEIEHNAALIEPGRTFRELADKALRHPVEFVAHRYACIAHGVGMSDEWPRVYHAVDWDDRRGYDGVFEAGMVVSVESFVGSDQGGPGVKLEQMYAIGESGTELLTAYPFEDGLLA